MFRFSLNRLLKRCHTQRTRPATVKHRPILEQLEDRTVPAFAAPVAFTVGNDPGAIITADFNNDGRLDLANPNYGSGSVSVLLGNGDGTFQAARHSPTGPVPGWLAAADFNNDGFLDLVTTHADSYLNSVNVLLGQGDGTFQAPATYDLDDVFGAGAYNLTVAVGDVNADGSADIVTMWESSVEFMWLRRTLLNSGDGTFSPLPTIQSESASYNPLNLADVDEDGRLDLLGDYGLWKGNGDGTFTFVAFEVHGQVVADFNGDRHLDIASAGPELSVEVRLGTGTGGFGSPQTYSTPHHQQNAPLGVGDFNADGRLDLLVRTDSGVTALTGKGDGTFADPVNFTAAGGGLAVADFNGDGYGDFASNDWADAVLVFMNDRVWNLPTIRIADVTVTEGNSGSVNAAFTLTLSHASAVDVTVHYVTANITAAAGSDYTAASGDVTIPAGHTSRTFTIAVTGDRLAEPTETFAVNLSAPTNATIADGQGLATIIDDEPRISIGDVTKSEGKKGQMTLFTFTITLSAAYDQAVTMSFATANGTATASDNDYIARTGTLTFAPGETTKTITIEVKGDSKREADETFFVDLTGAVNALFTKKRGVGTIGNDD